MTLSVRHPKADRVIVSGPSTLDLKGTDADGWGKVPERLFKAITETFGDVPGAGALFTVLYVAAIEHHGAAAVKRSDLLSLLGWRTVKLENCLRVLRERGAIAWDEHSEGKSVVVVYRTAQDSCVTTAQLDDLCTFCAERPHAKACSDAVQGISRGEKRREEKKREEEKRDCSSSFPDEDYGVTITKYRNLHRDVHGRDAAETDAQILAKARQRTPADAYAIAQAAYDLWGKDGKRFNIGIWTGKNGDTAMAYANDKLGKSNEQTG